MTTPPNPAAVFPGAQNTGVVPGAQNTAVDPSVQTTVVNSGAQTTVVAVGPAGPSMLDDQVGTTVLTTSASGSSRTASPTLQNPTASPSDSFAPVQVIDGSSNHGVSKGAVAGIAIGTCVLGAAIASLIAFLLFKKRNKKGNTGLMKSATGYTSYADSSPELVMEAKNAMQSPYTRVLQAPAPGPIPQSVHPTPTLDTVLAFLPPVADTSSVQGRVLGLFDQVYQHVDVYYRDVHASITPSMEPDLARFGAQGVDMAELLQICARPTVALKHALGAWVLGITGPGGDQQETVFPEQLRRGRAERSVNHDDSTASTAKSLHRRLSAYIYTSALSSHPPHSSRASLVPQTSAAMREAAEHFSLTFFPWGNPSSRDVEREEDLLRILSEALELQVWLFGQPDEWVFEWGGADRGIVVRPSLQRTDERGESRVVLEKDIVGV